MTTQEAIRHLEAARLMLLGKDGQPISDLYNPLDDWFCADGEPRKHKWCKNGRCG